MGKVSYQRSPVLPKDSLHRVIHFTATVLTTLVGSEKIISLTTIDLILTAVERCRQRPLYAATS